MGQIVKIGAMVLVLLLVLTTTPVTDAQSGDLSEEQLLQRIKDVLDNIRITLNKLLSIYTTTTSSATSTIVPESSSSGPSSQLPTVTAESSASSTDSSTSAANTAETESSMSSLTSTVGSDSSTSSLTSTMASDLSTTSLTSTMVSDLSTSSLASTMESESSTSSLASTMESDSSTSSLASTTESESSTSSLASTTESESSTSSFAPPFLRFDDVIRAETTGSPGICSPLNDTDPTDLCVRLKDVLHQIETITQEVANGNVTEEILRELENQSNSLDDVVKEIQDSGGVEVNLDELAEEIQRIEDETEKATSVVEDRLKELQQQNNVLAIVLGVVGSVLVIALLGMFGFVVYKKKQMKKPYNKVSGEEIPVKTFLESSGQDNAAFNSEEPRGRSYERASPRKEDLPDSSRYDHRTEPDPYRLYSERSYASLDRASHNQSYTGGRSQSSLDRTKSRSHAFERPSSSLERTNPRPRAVERPKSSHEVPARHYSTNERTGEDRHNRPSRRDDDSYDPYSLDRPGVKKNVYSGKLRRIDP